MATLLTTTRMKTVLGLAAGVTFYDVALGYACDGAEDYVLRSIGQTLWAVTTTSEYPEVYDEGQVEVSLRHTPVVSMGVVTNGDYALTTDEYRVDTENGLVRLRGSGTRRYSYWSTDRDGVQVTYGWGYTADTAPGELVRAMEMIAADTFNRTPKAGMKTLAQSGYSHTLTDDDIPAAARAILVRYTDAHHS
jgi:hypothetical protein